MTDLVYRKGKTVWRRPSWTPSTRQTVFNNEFFGPPAGVVVGFKVYSGAVWEMKPAKVWTGSAWVIKPVKRWSGSAWV